MREIIICPASERHRTAAWLVRGRRLRPLCGGGGVGTAGQTLCHPPLCREEGTAHGE